MDVEQMLQQMRFRGDLMLTWEASAEVWRLAVNGNDGPRVYKGVNLERVVVAAYGYKPTGIVE